MEKVKSVIHHLGQVQKQHIKDFVAGDYANEFKFGLVEVVYEWAKGTVSRLVSWFNIATMMVFPFVPLCIRYLVYTHLFSLSMT